MQYIRITTKQEAVEAESHDEAQTKEGNLIETVVRVIARPTAENKPAQSTTLAGAK